MLVSLFPLYYQFKNQVLWSISWLRIEDLIYLAAGLLVGHDTCVVKLRQDDNYFHIVAGNDGHKLLRSSGFSFFEMSDILALFARIRECLQKAWSELAIPLKPRIVR